MLNITIKQIDECPYNDVTKEAYWSICNLVEKSDTEVKIKLIREKDLVRLLVAMIREAQKETRIVEIVLVATEKLLVTAMQFEDNDNQHPLYKFQEEGGCDLLEDLQQTPNVSIFALSQRILKHHFPGGEENRKQYFINLI